MNIRTIVTLMVCLVAPILHAAEGDQLLTPQPWQSSFTGKHAASFYSINANAFSAARGLADDQTITLAIQLPKFGTVEIVAARYRVINERTSIAAMTASGPQAVPAPQSVLLRGRIREIPDSYVILAIYPDWCTGVITTGKLNAQRTYHVSPLEKPKQGPQVMVVYDGADVPTTHDWNCSTLDPANIVVPNTKVEDRSQAATFRKVTIAIECDEPFYIDLGRDVTRASQYAEAVVAASSAIYERDVQATLAIGSLLVWTTADPYVSNLPDEMLVQFRDRWRTLNGAIVRSVAHLLSGVNNIGGIAYVDQLCNKQWAYAVSGTNNNITYPATGYVWDTDVFSHELGHNVGSPHTHSCTWSPPIDSCYTSEGGCFAGTKAVKGTIMSYCHLTTAGTDLSFHSRVVTLMKGKLSASACTPLIAIFDISTPVSQAVCAGNAVTIVATPTGNVGKVSYRWRGPTFDTVTTVASFQFVPTASVQVFVTGTDSSGNVASDTTSITVRAKPLASVQTNDLRVCRGTIVEITSTISGGRVPYTYRWLRNGIVIDTLSDIVWPKMDTTSIIKLITTDLYGCGDTAQLLITVPDQRLVMTPSPFVLPQLAMCENVVNTKVTLRNDGLETVMIDSVKSGSSISVKTTLPLAIPPASAIEMFMEVTVKKFGAITDTLVFVEKLCNTRMKLPLTGIRPAPRATSPLPIDLGAKLVCDIPTERWATLRISNPSSFAMQINGVAGKQLGNTVDLANRPVTVLPNSEQDVSVVTSAKRLPGLLTDSLVFAYVSKECEGSFVLPAVMRVTGLTIDHPSSISFDTVLTSEASRSKTFSVGVSLVGAGKATVTSVRVEGPFTTTLSEGLVLLHGKQSQVTVSIAPSLLTVDGAVKGSLVFMLDSCATERVVALSAVVRVVGVANDALDVFNMIDEARFYDLRGLQCATVQANGVEPSVPEALPRGVYLMVLSSEGKVRSRRLISR
ncbi:MAG: zinc-dependent metalloprotease [Candidatus Kapabacteria bacterium]|nr:zinc-dependent metalloprotease [Candidatus Kapabacteria bacterium]